MMLCGFFKSPPVRIIIGDLKRVCFTFFAVSGAGSFGRTPVTAQRAVVSSLRPRGPEMACLTIALQARLGSGELRAIFAATEKLQSSQSPSDAMMTTPPDLGNGIDIVKGSGLMKGTLLSPIALAHMTPPGHPRKGPAGPPFQIIYPS